MIDSTEANVTCSESNSATIKLAIKNIKWMLLTFNEKIVKSEGLISLTVIKCSISFLFIGKLSKIKQDCKKYQAFR